MLGDLDWLYYDKTRARGPCGAWGELFYCAADCGFAPWNVRDETYEDLPKTNRFGYLRRMVKWVGWHISRDDIKWTKAAPSWGRSC